MNFNASVSTALCVKGLKQSLQHIWPAVMMFLLKHQYVTGGEILNLQANAFFFASHRQLQLKGFFNAKQ